MHSHIKSQMLPLSIGILPEGDPVGLREAIADPHNRGAADHRRGGLELVCRQCVQRAVQLRDELRQHLRDGHRRAAVRLVSGTTGRIQSCVSAVAAGRVRGCGRNRPTDACLVHAAQRQQLGGDGGARERLGPAQPLEQRRGPAA